MKRISIIALFIVFAFSAQAQRFEWATGYTVDHGGKTIQGGVTDSAGNLYILGFCDGSSLWDGHWVLPSINKYTKNDPAQTLIAKISPDGEMIWKKVIFSNNGQGNLPCDIKKIGDTAFACLINFSPPTNDNYTYYLDTFLFGNVDYPIDTRYFQSDYLAYLVFGFDGELKEQHFLTTTFTDANGNDILRHYSSGIDTTPWLIGPLGNGWAYFDVDRFGNIYISRRSLERYLGSDGIYYSTEEGAIRGLKFWVNRRLVGEYRIGGHPKFGTPQLLKFSPHFDTLLACKYVTQKSKYEETVYQGSYIKVDRNGNVYYKPIIGNITSGDLDTVVIDSVSHASYIARPTNAYCTYLVSYDTDLNFRWLITFEDSIIRDYTTFKSFNDIGFDYDSNLVFLSAMTVRHIAMDTGNYHTLLTYQGEALPLKKDGVCVASFYNTDTMPRLHSYGVIPAFEMASCGYDCSKDNLYCKNNRIVLQCNYHGGIKLPSRTIRYNNLSDGGYGMLVLDYSGKLVDGIDFNTITHNFNKNAPGPIISHDSVLYLCGRLVANATFGDIVFTVSDNTNYIAKYVDTAFMHPYVRPSHGINTVTAVTPRVFPVPASDRLHFDCPAGVVPTAVAAISLSGWRMPLTATATTADISCLAPGAYILEITTTKEKYYTKFIKGR